MQERLLMPVMVSYARRLPTEPSQTLVKSWGEVRGSDAWGIAWASVLGPRPRVEAVGWAAGFLDRGLTQRDHLDFLWQHPLPEQTQRAAWKSMNVITEATFTPAE